jgi:hypothetical protein
VDEIKRHITELPYTATARVAEAIASLGRTEDVRFSPSNRRLALAGFRRGRLAVFDVEIAAAASGETSIALSGGVELTSPALKSPHGLDFIDDHHLIVTNRAGDVAIFVLPVGTLEIPLVECAPVQIWPAGGQSLLHAPGSVAAVPVSAGEREVLICNNGNHTVTRHLLNWRDESPKVAHSEVLLAKRLDVPDGVAVSSDGRWIAVSNHHTHSVLLYERTTALNAETEPDGILRRVLYAHGIRFSGDGRYLFVADAGAPYLHVYAAGPRGWRGVHQPASIRVMDDDQYKRGRHNPTEGGPKGLDVDRSERVLVLTSEHQPLSFFDRASLIERAGSMPPDDALDLQHELASMEAQEALSVTLREAQSLIAYMRGSASWRITAPLRRLHSAWQPRPTKK